MGGFEALLLIGAGVLIYTNTVTKAAGNLIFFPGNPTGITLDDLNPVITLQLVVQNTSNVDFTFNSLAGNVACDNTLIGNISNFRPVTVYNNSQSTIPLTITMFPLGIVDNIISAFYGGFQQKELTVNGSVNANGQQVPLLLKFKVG